MKAGWVLFFGFWILLRTLGTKYAIAPAILPAAVGFNLTAVANWIRATLSDAKDGLKFPWNTPADKNG